MAELGKLATDGVMSPEQLDQKKNTRPDGKERGKCGSSV
jgi:hypothetical protein